MMALPGAVVTVELYLDSAWVDITSYVRVRDGISIKFGVQAETGTADPATCTLVVDNADGRFTPNNPEGPYYGFLKRNTSIRVLYDAEARYIGEVSEFPPEWDPTGSDVTVSLTAAGPLRRLLRGRALNTALKTVVQSLAESGDITGYWPMEDAEGSTSFASALPGGTPMAITSGAPAMASFDPGAAYAGSAPIAVFNTGDTGFGQTSGGSGTGFTLGFLLGVPAAGITDETELINVFCNGSIALWSIAYDNGGGGALRLRAFTFPGGVITEVLNNLTDYLVDGTPRYMKLEVQQDGGNVDWALSAFGVGTAGGTINTQTIGAPVHTIVNPPGTVDDVAFGHVILAKTSTALFTTAFDDGLDAYTGESVEDRVDRLAGVAGLMMTVVTNSTGGTEDSMTLGPQPAGTVLDGLRDAEAADMGLLRDSILSRNALVYATRRYFYNTDPVLTLDYSAGHLTPPLAPVDDDQLTRNDVTITRTGGSSARATDTTSPLSIEPPPDGVGVYGYSATVNVELDTQLPQVAGWVLAGGTLDVTRFPQVTVDLVRNPSLAADVDAIRPGMLIEITNLPVYATSETVRLHVMGWTEYISEARRTFTFNCRPADVYDVVRLDDDQYGRLDSEDTTTNEALDTTETGVDYTGDTWTTTATRPDDFPFDIEIGGEVMTVTAATGSTFTVTRSVNGVVKSHLTGQPIRLHRPNRIAL